MHTVILSLPPRHEVHCEEMSYGGYRLISSSVPALMHACIRATHTTVDDRRVESEAPSLQVDPVWYVFSLSITSGYAHDVMRERNPGSTMTSSTRMVAVVD